MCNNLNHLSVTMPFCNSGDVKQLPVSHTIPSLPRSDCSGTFWRRRPRRRCPEQAPEITGLCWVVWLGHRGSLQCPTPRNGWRSSWKKESWTGGYFSPMGAPETPGNWVRTQVQSFTNNRRIRISHPKPLHSWWQLFPGVDLTLMSLEKDSKINMREIRNAKISWVKGEI